VQCAARYLRLPGFESSHLPFCPSINVRGRSPELPYWITHSVPQGGLGLVTRGSSAAILYLGLDSKPCGTQFHFTADGQRLAYGNEDGSVTVCDVPEIRRRLHALGLAW
jgi:hypothetical protein